jgi:hypothetical protein
MGAVIVLGGTETDAEEGRMVSCAALAIPYGCMPTVFDGSEG